MEKANFRLKDYILSEVVTLEFFWRYLMVKKLVFFFFFWCIFKEYNQLLILAYIVI